MSRWIVCLCLVGCATGPRVVSRGGSVVHEALMALAASGRPVRLAVYMPERSVTTTCYPAQLGLIGDWRSPIIRAYERATQARLLSVYSFPVVDRANLDLVIEEQQRQVSGMVSSQTVVEAGQLVGLTHLILMEWSYNCGDRCVYLTSRLVEVESGRIVAMQTVGVKP